jgi:Zn-dependent protease
MRNSIRIGKVLGIEVRLDVSWFIIFFLITWSLAGHYLMVYEGWRLEFRIALSLVTAILFFASVLAHELGHSVVATSTGVPVKCITLFIFGGMAQITREPKRARDEFLIAVAGPVVSLLLAVGFGLVWMVSQRLEVCSLMALGAWLGGINLSLALFNLIPGYPLDGGRILRSVIWGLTGNLSQATYLVSALGQGVAFFFIFIGIWQMFAGNWLGSTACGLRSLDGS